MKRVSQHTETHESMSLTFNQFLIDRSFSLTKKSFFNLLNLDIRPSQIKDTCGESEIIKEGYLKGLFTGDQLSQSDFRFMPNNSVLYYLDGFSESVEEWGEDRQVFKGFLKKLSDKLSDNISGTYLINKEWFDEDSPKVRSREHHIYDFYLLIVWQHDSTLIVCEWSAD